MFTSRHGWVPEVSQVYLIILLLCKMCCSDLCVSSTKMLPKYNDYCKSSDITSVRVNITWNLWLSPSSHVAPTACTCTRILQGFFTFLLITFLGVEQTPHCVHCCWSPPFKACCSNQRGALIGLLLIYSSDKNRPCYLHISDQRVRGWLLLDNYPPTFALTVMYLLIVWMGPKYMKHRQPYSCRGLLVLYNLGLTLLSFYMFYEVNRLLGTERRGEVQQSLRCHTADKQ